MLSEARNVPLFVSPEAFQFLLQFCYMVKLGAGQTDKYGMRLFHSLFVRYGTGSGLFLPITQAKCWNVVAWTVIALGTLAWGIALLVWNF